MSQPLETLVRSELAELGGRIRGLRAQREWTLDELAKRAGLSKSYLSRLEDGERQPSLAALLSLGQAFGVALAALFPPDRSAAEDCVIVRAADAVARAGSGLSYTPLSSGARPSQMQPIRVTVPARRTGDERYRHEGEEWLCVLSGRLRLTLADETHDLGPGDCAHFDARLPHRLTALGGKDAELILVACAAPRLLLQSYL